MRKVLIILMVATFVLAMTGLALATDPGSGEDTPFTFIESNSPTGIPSTGYSNDPYPSGSWKMGASNWRYKDSYDAAAKYEGSYREFDSYASGGLYTANPHGGYSTGSNKCKTCHAVHRASGGFKLMRVDDPNDACSYCHVGTHLHSNKAAYFAGDATVYPTNGHTIGSGKSIPDSSTWQWLEAKTLTGGDTGEFSAVVNIRRYNAAKNKIMMWSAPRASYHAHGGLERWGPTLLTCMSCHQPHNASNLIWKPDATNGYKLLRSAPSGGVVIPAGAARGGVAFTSADNKAWMETYSPWSAGYPIAIGRAVQDTLSASNTGMANALGDGSWPDTSSGNVGKTIYTQWKSRAFNVAEAAPRLSVWCADCHNLNIGYYERIGEPNFRGGKNGEYHSDRTHSAGGRIECWNCHNTSLVTQSSNYTGVGCAKCHWYNNGATIYNTYNAGSDFPHAGATTSTKLLADDYDASTEHLDFICIRCHDLVGVDM